MAAAAAAAAAAEAAAAPFPTACMCLCFSASLARASDGKPVSPPPQFQDLDAATRQAIMEALALDFVLYERADTLLDSHISYLRTQVDWEQVSGGARV